LQGQSVPVVEEYTYLGVLISGKDTYGCDGFAIRQANRLKKLINRLRPFLSSKTIPVNVRVWLWRSMVEPIARWGSEIFGFHLNADGPFGRVAKEYNVGIRLLVGSDSKNTIYSDLCLRSELGLPSLPTIASMARARAAYKFPKLKTVISKLMNQRQVARKKSWVTLTMQWLKSRPKLDPLDGAEWKGVKIVMEVYLEEAEYNTGRGNSTKSFKAWKEARFKATALFWKRADFQTHLAKGVNWLIRMRCSGIWTVESAIKRELMVDEISGKCPGCERNLSGPETEHVVLECTEYNSQRVMISDIVARITDMSGPAETLKVLIGGVGKTNDGRDFSMGAQWSRDVIQNPNGPGTPAYCKVAEFLGAVYPRHMGALWKWRVPDPPIPDDDPLQNRIPTPETGRRPRTRAMARLEAGFVPEPTGRST
jgi:hypothetical protein